jgi:hypothetical protein
MSPIPAFEGFGFAMGSERTSVAMDDSGYVERHHQGENRNGGDHDDHRCRSRS